MTNILFDDSVTATNLPAGQPYGFFYGDGRYANAGAVRARLGVKAKLLCVTVTGKTGEDYHIADCEKGNMTQASVEAWVQKQLRLGVYRPCVYADQSTWKGTHGLEAALATYGSRIKRFMASYDGVAEVPQGYDAKQYAGNVAPGVDKNVALESFFDVEAPPKPKPAPKPVAANTGTVHFAGSFELTTGTWVIHRLTSTGEREIAETYRATVEIDVAPGSKTTVQIKEQA